MNDRNCDETRRNFLEKTALIFGLTVAGGTAASLLQSCEKDWEKPNAAQNITIDLDVTQYPFKPKDKFGRLFNLVNTGSGIITRFPNVNYGIPILVIKTGEHNETIEGTDTLVPEFAVYSAMCTHNNCMGNPDYSKTKISPSMLPPGNDDYSLIICNCHGSKYDPFNHAKVIQGPAEKPLKEFSCSYNPETKILSINF